MRILERHIARHVVAGSLVALSILVAVDLVFAFAAEVNDIGEGSYSIDKTLLYVFLTIPRRAYDFLPMAAIVGSMVMIGNLAQNSELTAMRSSGVSVMQITRAILKGGLYLVLIALVLGEGIAPFSEPYAQQMRSFAQTESTALKSRHGIWARDGLSFVNIRHIRPDGELRQLEIYEFDRNFQLRVQTQARRAVFGDDSWTLHNIKQTHITDDELQIDHYKEARWEALLNPELLSVLAVKPEQLALWRLTTYMEYLRLNELETRPYEFAFWKKITSPLAILIMLFVSVPFMFTHFRMSGTGQRTLLGIIIGIVYLLMTHVTISFGEVYKLDPFLSNAVPMLCFILAGVAGLRLMRG